jgi:hemin uptake protein HemP
MRFVLNRNGFGRLKSPSEQQPAPPETGTTPAVLSRDLLRNGRELVILHGNERYRLLLTKSNKLILTK